MCFYPVQWDQALSGQQHEAVRRVSAISTIRLRAAASCSTSNKITATRRTIHWTDLADSFAQDAVAAIRNGLQPGVRGAPIQPGPLFFGIVVGEILNELRAQHAIEKKLQAQQKGGASKPSRRRAARLLAEHLCRSAKLSPEDRSRLGIPPPDATKRDIDLLADRLRKR